MAVSMRHFQKIIKKKLALNVGDTILQTETSVEPAFICFLAYQDVNEHPHSSAS